MKIPRILKIKATTLILIAGTGGALFAYADDAVIRKAGITEFQSERIKCYCTEDGKVGLRLQGENLDKHFRSTDGSVDIYQCGKSNRVLILLRVDSAVGGNSTCYESAERVLGDFHNCWIKESYIEQDKGCGEAAQAGDLELADQHARCEQLGAVLGAGACKKEDKD